MVWYNLYTHLSIYFNIYKQSMNITFENRHIHVFLNKYQGCLEIIETFPLIPLRYKPLRFQQKVIQDTVMFINVNNFKSMKLLDHPGELTNPPLQKNFLRLRSLNNFSLNVEVLVASNILFKITMYQVLLQMLHFVYFHTKLLSWEDRAIDFAKIFKISVNL